MPLDTAAVTPGLDVSLGTDRYDRGVDSAPTLESAASIGAGLRAVREYYRLSIEDVALATCIRKLYLAGIEEMRLDDLPSRPFVIGYVRAYAGALGLDPDRAVARFKMEFPDETPSLRAPLGVTREGDRRLRPILIGFVLVVLAFVAWNIAQRAMSKSEPRRNTGTEVAVSSARVKTPVASGPIVVGAPLPAPQESTLPAPYVTPGLQPASADGSATSAAPIPAKPVPVAPTAPVGAPFAAHGAIYGAAAGQSSVTLQAAKSASLIIRGGDGAVYFARQLAAGEAYRAPLTAGLSVEAPDPTVINVFVGGALKGPLPAAKMAVAKLTDPGGH
jgi:cytoskeleton protein RodZ